MLSRRVLRIKVMQSLYAFILCGDDHIEKAEKAMMLNTNRIYDLFIYQLSALVEIADTARKILESGKLKHFPSEEEQNPRIKFIDNHVIRLIDDNTEFRKYFNALRINWADQQDLFRKIFLQIRDTSEYKEYMLSVKSNFEEDKRFIVTIFRDHLAECEELQQLYEEKNIFWADDYDIVSYMIVKTLNSFSSRTDIHTPLPELFIQSGENVEDETEDKTFMRDLFRKTIFHADEYDKWIAEKAENWELERIAMMDSILLRMAICELTSFPSIPIKVTLNEYIEISKIYSTAKSRIFINGLLDKLIVKLKSENKIRKIGRGLME